VIFLFFTANKSILADPERLSLTVPRSADKPPLIPVFSAPFQIYLSGRLQKGPSYSIDFKQFVPERDSQGPNCTQLLVFLA
jgi:hypothetical protein